MPNKAGIVVGDYVTKSGVELDDVQYGTVSAINANKITVNWATGGSTDEDPSALRFTSDEAFTRHTTGSPSTP